VRWVTCFPDGDLTPRVCTLLHVQHITCCHGGQVAWSDRAKAAYKSSRDYIIAVKGKMRQRVTERVGGVSANLVDFVEWRLLVWLTVSRVHSADSAMFGDIIRCSAMFADIRRTYPMFSDVRRYSAILSELQFTIVTPVTVLRRPASRPDAQLLAGITRGHAWV